MRRGKICLKADDQFRRDERRNRQEDLKTVRLGENVETNILKGELFCWKKKVCTVFSSRGKASNNRDNSLF